MEIVLIITLIAAVLILLPQSASQPSQPQYMIIQAVPSEPAASGPGCLVWVIGGLVLLTLLGVIHW
jgi:hypothetical protein